MATNKMSIAWHRECLKNWQNSLLSKMDELRRINDEVSRMRQDIITYDSQIIEAETRRVDGFDRERFGKKRTAR